MRAWFRAQVPNRAARFRQAVVGEMLRLLKHFACGIEGGGHEASNELQLNRDADKSLGQGVMDLAGNTIALCDYRIELISHVIDAPAIERIGKSTGGKQ